MAGNCVPADRERRRYAPVELTEDKARYIKVPMQIITDTEENINRVAVYAYISMYKGLNSKMLFSIPRFLNWAGFKSDSHMNGINGKVVGTLFAFQSLEYLQFIDKHQLTAPFELKIDNQSCYDMGVNDFSLLYLDEIEKIMSYRRANPKDAHLNSLSVLLVFAYLRRKIFRRPNFLMPEERYPDMIKDRQKRCPEAYADSYKHIASELGISERTVSESVKILEKFQLIVYKEAYHIKSEECDYVTPYTMFANFEKRENKYLLDSGLKYAYSEMDRKALLIAKNSRLPYKLKDKKSIS